MSRWLNMGTFLGGMSGAVAAAVAVWQVAQPGLIDNADAVVKALNGIRDAIEGGQVDLSQTDTQMRVARAAQPVADLLARNLNTLSTDDLAGLGGIADAAIGETVELRLPDGAVTQITFRGWNNRSPDAALVFEGETIPTRAGWQTTVGAGDACTLSYVGIPRGQPDTARFRLRCS